MEGADIYQIAKNCRTSVEMIEKYYASHIKNSLDAAAINIRKKKPSERPQKAGGQQADVWRQITAGHRLKQHAGVAESADASDLSENLSARRETGDAELLKFGEPCNMAIPSQARPETAGKV